MATVVRFHRPGPPSVLQVEDQDPGTPQAGQVRLRQEAIGVNFIDTAFRDGSFNFPVPAVAGVEAAGVIEEIGPEVDGFTVGDRVAYFFAPGSYASERTVDASVLVPLPDTISAETSAAILTKGITAWMGLRALHRLQAGETILIQGATGGVGTLLASWAKALGATVIGTGSADKLDRLEGILDHAIASDDPELGIKVRSIAPDGVDVVYEFVGRATFDASIEAVRDGGTILTIGAASGAPTPRQDMLEARRISVARGSAAASVTGDVLATASREVFDCLEKGVFGTPLIKRYALDEAARAHADVAARARDGFLVLIP